MHFCRIERRIECAERLRHVTCVALDPTGAYLAIGGMGALLVCDLERPRQDRLVPLSVHDQSDAGAVRSIAFDMRGEALVASTRARALCGPASGVFRVGIESAPSILMSSDGEKEFGPVAISRLGDTAITIGNVLVWRFANGAERTIHLDSARPITSLRFSPHGDTVALSTDEGLWVLARVGGLRKLVESENLILGTCRRDSRSPSGPLHFDTHGKRIACQMKRSLGADRSIVIAGLDSGRKATRHAIASGRPIWFDARLEQVLVIEPEGALLLAGVGSSKQSSVGNLGSAPSAEISVSTSADRIAFRSAKDVLTLTA